MEAFSITHNQLIPTQGTLNAHRLDSYLAGLVQNDSLPEVVATDDDMYFNFDGSHRLAVQMLQGAEQLTVVAADIDSFSIIGAGRIMRQLEISAGNARLRGVDSFVNLSVTPGDGLRAGAYTHLEVPDPDTKVTFLNGYRLADIRARNL